MVEMNDKTIEELKTALFMGGTDAIDDFLGYECPYDDKDTIDNLFDEVIEQMPDDIFAEYYKKYCM